MIDQYRDSVRELSDFISDYGRSKYTGKELATEATQIRTLANRDFSKYPLEKKLDHVYLIGAKIDGVFLTIYPDLTQVKRLDDPEQTLTSLLMTEPLRFAKIRERGFVPLFETYDAQFVKGSFFRKLPAYGSDLARFRDAVRLIAEDVQNFELHELGYLPSDLLMAARELSSSYPDAEDRNGKFLSDRYVSFRSGCENSMKFIYRLGQFREIMVKVYEAYGWDPDDIGLPIKGTDVDVLTLDSSLEDHVKCLAEMHVRFTLSAMLEVI